MFPFISKSKYVFFVKVEGFTKLPSSDRGLDSDNSSNSESSIKVLDTPLLNKPKLINAGEDTGGGGAVKTSYICCAILLEDQIIKALHLNTLGIYNLKDEKTADIIKDLSIINLSSKSSAVKSGFINYWRASFEATTKEEAKDFKNVYTLSFITPSYIEKNAIEKNLTSKVSIQPTSNSPTYKYIRNSLDRISGRKYKN